MPNSLIYSHLYAWYEANHRVLPWRDTENPYAIWLSEIILQQTRVAQGMEYYMRFVARWPKVEDLAAAKEEEVLREWQGLGYYSRARNLHKAAIQIVESQKSKVESGAQSGYRFPRTFEDIRSLPGIGDYTAGAIASFAYNRPYPAMDGNVYRVLARLLDIDEPFDTTAGKKLFRKEIDRLLDRNNPRLFNSAIMEFGALYCTPTLGDACETCPLKDACLGYAHGTAELLPVRKARPKVRDRWFIYHIYLLENTDRSADGIQNTDLYTLIQKRENPKDIWYHLYDFPYEECDGVQQSDSVCTLSAKRSVLCQPQAVCELSHTLSHQRIHARYIIHKVQKMPDLPGTIAIPWEDLNDYALSRLTLRALDTLRSVLPR